MPFERSLEIERRLDDVLRLTANVVANLLPSCLSRSEPRQECWRQRLRWFSADHC